MEIDPNDVVRYIQQRWPEHVEIALLHLAIEKLQKESEPEAKVDINNSQSLRDVLG